MVYGLCVMSTLRVRMSMVLSHFSELIDSVFMSL